MSEYIVCPHCHNPLSQSEYVKVVRCRDCEFGAYDGNECMRIDEWDGSLWFPVEPDGFCAWGERKVVGE